MGRGVTGLVILKVVDVIRWVLRVKVKTQSLPLSILRVRLSPAPCVKYEEETSYLNWHYINKNRNELQSSKIHIALL